MTYVHHTGERGIGIHWVVKYECSASISRQAKLNDVP